VNLQDDLESCASGSHHLLSDDDRSQCLRAVVDDKRSDVTAHYESLAWTGVEDVKDRPFRSR
jgi:hypothetical protein